MGELKRFGVSVEEGLLEKFDDLIADSYKNRSEAIRDLIRKEIIKEESKAQDKEVVGVLTLLYNHQQRNLPEKLVEVEHNYNCLFRSNLHLYLDNNNCLEVIVIQGAMAKINKVAKKLAALKGVKHNGLTITTVNEAF